MSINPDWDKLQWKTKFFLYCWSFGFHNSRFHKGKNNFDPNRIKIGLTLLGSIRTWNTLGYIRHRPKMNNQQRNPLQNNPNTQKSSFQISTFSFDPPPRVGLGCQLSHLATGSNNQELLFISQFGSPEQLRIYPTYSSDFSRNLTNFYIRPWNPARLFIRCWLLVGGAYGWWWCEECIPGKWY